MSSSGVPNEEDLINKYEPILDRFFRLESWRKEWSLYLTRGSLEKRGETERWRYWLDRFEAWGRHLNVYDAIQQTHEKSSCTPPVEKLSGLLTVLDSKIGMALSINALLLGTAAVFVSWVPKVVAASSCTWPNPIPSAIRWAMHLFLLVGFGLLFWSLWVLLQGFRRVVWGDLGAELTKPPDGQQGKEQYFKNKEDEYKLFLIVSIARRTNSFRISTYLTKIALAVLIVLVLLGVGVPALSRSDCDTGEGGLATTQKMSSKQRLTIDFQKGNLEFEASEPTIIDVQSRALTLDQTRPGKSKCGKTTPEVKHQIRCGPQPESTKGRCP